MEFDTTDAVGAALQVRDCNFNVSFFGDLKMVEIICISGELIRLTL